jgi:putative ABC transport system substrate-binding protein
MQFDQLKRRELITLLGGASAWPLAARAQQRGKIVTVGFLGAGTHSVYSEWVAAFAQRLRELGWIEGRNISIEYRWAESRPERFAEIAAEFVRLQVDVIVANANAAVMAAKQATSVIPIVFSAAGDPVGTGLVASLSHPGGNITGFSINQTELASKRVELLREVVPSLHRLAIMANVGNPAAPLEIGEVRRAALALGLDAVPIEVTRNEEIATAFGSLKDRAEAIYLVGDPLIASNRVRIITLALSARLPTMFSAQEHVQAGALISYGPNFPDLYRRAGDIVDKILRGAKPADIPVEQPTKFDLAVNLTTAKALGITVPPTVLALANEVIE